MFRTKLLSAFAVTTAFLLPTTFLNAQPQGQVWSWGFARNGELGTGSESNSSFPQHVKNIVFVDIDAKKSFSAGITPDGKVFTWGKNRNGILGHLPANLNLLLPRQVEIGQKVNQVSLGYQTMCLVTEQGQAFVWGLQQKKGGFRSITTVEPQKKDALCSSKKIELPNVKMASCANDYIVLANKQGKVFVMGDLKIKGVNNTQAQTKNDLVELPLNRITKISSGINFTMALDDQGKVYVWGSNTNGQLGTGGLRSTFEPVLVEALLKQKIVDISAGDNYSGVVTEKGEVYTWGFGNEGQLGHGDKSDQFMPRRIANLKSKVKSISCGGAHTALLTEDGKLLMVGRGREGQLGREQMDESSGGYTLNPKEVEQLPPGGNILKVKCGASHTMVLMDLVI